MSVDKTIEEIDAVLVAARRLIHEIADGVTVVVKRANETIHNFDARWNQVSYCARVRACFTLP